MIVLVKHNTSISEHSLNQIHDPLANLVTEHLQGAEPESQFTTEQVKIDFGRSDSHDSMSYDIFIIAPVRPFVSIAANIDLRAGRIYGGLERFFRESHTFSSKKFGLLVPVLEGGVVELLGMRLPWFQ